MEEFVTDDDLMGLIVELDEVENISVGIEEDDVEMEASNRRYLEIIKKHQND